MNKELEGKPIGSNKSVTGTYFAGLAIELANSYH